MLPPKVAEEVLRRYADLLRVGRITLNGETASWQTDTSNEFQLHGFCATVSAKLRELLPDLAEDNPVVLQLASYWLLKAVSINYALIEVVVLVRERVGVLCTIETRDERGGASVDYSVEVLPGPSLRVSITWRKGNNIVYCDPRTAERKVKGTLTNLATEFRLPPEPGFVPAYSLDMQLRRSLAAKIVSRLGCVGSDHNNMNLIHVDEPLSLGDFFEASAHAIARPCDKATVDHGDFELVGSPISRTSTEAREDMSDPLLWNSKLVVDDGPVGHLRVHVLRVRTIIQGNPSLPLSAPSTKQELYGACTVGGKTERTRATLNCANPEWWQRWDFPVRTKDLRGEVLFELFGVDGKHGGLELLGTAGVLVSHSLSRPGKVTVSEPLQGRKHSFVDLELELLPDLVARQDGCNVIRTSGTPRKGDHSAAGIPLRPVYAEDLRLRIRVHAASPIPTPCTMWCSRSCTRPCVPECT